MRSAFKKDMWRSVTKSKKRFFAIMVITALGVTMLSGIKASCIDMRHTGDAFYDEQKLFDIRVVSTLGVTDNDVEALAKLSNVEQAEGGYSQTIWTELDGVRQDAVISSLSSSGMNEPYLLEGCLPESSGEAAVSKKYITSSGSKIGDTVTIKEKEETDTEESTANLRRTEFTITGIVLDPMEVSGENTAAAFRSSASENNRLFILPEDVKNDIYTAVYLTLADAKSEICYSKKYESLIDKTTQNIETEIKDQREQARYDELYQEASDKIADAENEMNEKLVDAGLKIADAKDDLAEGKEELKDGRSKIEKGEKELKDKEKEANLQFTDALKQLEDGEAQLQAGEQQWYESSSQLEEGEKQLAKAKEDYDKSKKKAESEFSAVHKQIEDGKAQTQSAQETLTAQQDVLSGSFGEFWPNAEWAALVDAATGQYQLVLQETLAEESVWSNIAAQWNAFLAKLAPLLEQQPQLSETINSLPQLALGLGKINATKQQLAAQETALKEQETKAYEQLDAGASQIKENEEKLRNARQQLTDGRTELDASRIKLTVGKSELAEQKAKAVQAFADARQTLADSKQDFENGEQKLKDGEQELSDKEQEYIEKKEDALSEISDAKEKLSEIDMTKWYIQNRTSLESYAGLKSDTDSIEAVGTAFPILFFIVAILISLTTITRMVEEERGLIGTYKALGIRDGAIYGKYLFYAFSACLLGGLLGDLFGFIFFPKFIWMIFSEMYALPEFVLCFDLLYGIGGVFLFMAGIVGATGIACRNELELLPAVLMRPKSPRAGTRVVFERIPLLWKRLKFLNKVTVRNLFRYKKRLFMTVIGIMGCTALILCGFAIRDSVTELMPKQYGYIYRYDLMTAFDSKEGADINAQFAKDENVEDSFTMQMESMKVQNEAGKEESIQVMAVPETSSFGNYIRLETKKGEPITLTDDSIVITTNAAQILELKAGSSISLQDQGLNRAQAKITDVTQNYLGNWVYMTQKTYERLFGTYEANGILLHHSKYCKDQPQYAEDLGNRENILSAVSTEALRRDFETNFAIVNAVVYLITVMAAGLAFVVLFTLSTTNISERERELSTIKVLGFYDPEVHQYVNKETVILTAMGILIGLPAGRALSECLTYVLNMPSIYFAVSVKPVSYAVTAGISLCFALIVELFTNRILDRIDMVEALKSVE